MMMGSAIALACALAWSVAVILLKKAGETVDALALNLGKNALSLLLLGPTVFLVEGGVDALALISQEDWILMMVSGFLGIGIADALVLRSMVGLSAGHIAILETLFAPFVIFFSYFILQEPLSTSLVAGGILITLAVVLVSPRNQVDSSETYQHRWPSVLLMAAGLLVMAFGIVLVKPALGRVPMMWVVFLRMVAGVASSLLVFVFVNHRWAKIRGIWRTPHRGTVALSFLFSSYIALILWVAGYKYNTAGFAAVLNQTSTIFTVLLGIWLLKERVTRSKILATILAFAGVVVMTVFSF